MLGIELTPAENLKIFPEKQSINKINKDNKINMINKDELKVALDARGKTVEPLRLLIERVYGTEYKQRLADIDTICGQPVKLEARLEEIRRGRPVMKLTRPKSEARKRASGRHKPKGKPKSKGKGKGNCKGNGKAARSVPQRSLSPAPVPEEADDDDGYETPDDKNVPRVTDSAAEDAGIFIAMLFSQAEDLHPVHRTIMHQLSGYLHPRPLFDLQIRGTKKPNFSPPPHLLEPGYKSVLEQQADWADKVAESEKSGCRMLGYEVLYCPPGETPRVLFAAIGEVLNAADIHGHIHSTLSYIDSDRAVLPDSIPGSVRTAIIHASIHTGFMKLSNCGAHFAWLSAYSPDWKKKKKTVGDKTVWEIYPQAFLVATSGRKYARDIELKSGVNKELNAAKSKRDNELVSTVYPKIFKEGMELHGIMASGSGPLLAEPGAGSTVPPFVDEVFTRLALYPSKKDRQPVTTGGTQPSFLDAELAESNKVAQIFVARLKAPEAGLAVDGDQLASALARVKIPEDHMDYYNDRATMFEEIVHDTMTNTFCLPEGYQTLGQLARAKIRAKVLELQEP